jgi:uncharacterized membrane protein (DUF4010 family)
MTVRLLLLVYFVTAGFSTLAALVCLVTLFIGGALGTLIYMRNDRTNEYLSWYNMAGVSVAGLVIFGLVALFCAYIYIRVEELK